MTVRTLPRDPPGQGKIKNHFKHSQEYYASLITLLTHHDREELTVRTLPRDPPGEGGTRQDQKASVNTAGLGATATQHL